MPIINAVENQIRPCALGRSNWLFAGSLRSGKRAAAIMSLIQSARMNGHDPYASLKDVLMRLPTQRASAENKSVPLFALSPFLPFCHDRKDSHDIRLRLSAIRCRLVARIKPDWAATRAPDQSVRAIAPARSDDPSNKASTRQTTGTTASAPAPGRRLPVLPG